MKRKVLIFIGFVLLVLFFLFRNESKLSVVKSSVKSIFIPDRFINKEGKTIVDRVKIPDGYKRVEYKQGTFQKYIQQYALKPYEAKIINYDGSKYFYQSGHFGILELPVPKNGLQQCADALIRIRAEYLWKRNRKDKIGFNFTSGHYCSWKKYAQGYRPKIKGNKVTFHKTAKANSSKANFYKYLNLIFIYSGTLSLYTELPKITSIKNLKVGDMLVKPGTPGHIAMIVDEIKNQKGEKLFLLAEGNTPAQSVHLLKNPMDKDISPWYALTTNNRIDTPLYPFENPKFIRFKN